MHINLFYYLSRETGGYRGVSKSLEKYLFLILKKEIIRLMTPKTTFVTEEVINVAFEVTSRRYECDFPPKSFYKQTFNDFSLNLHLYDMESYVTY